MDDFFWRVGAVPAYDRFVLVSPVSCDAVSFGEHVSEGL